jgi:N-methylhydantoinase B
MATTNIADRLVCLTQAAFAELGDGFGLAEGALGMGISYAVISGRDARFDGAPYVNQIFLGSTGGPGGPVADGWPTYYLPVAASLMYHDSTEVDEQKYPLHVHVKRLIPNSEGAGRRRGSFGSEVVYSPKQLPMTIAYSFEGHENPARGVRGGGTGAPSDGWKIDSDGNRVELPMAAALDIHPSERVLSRTGGGGGYGDPITRDPELVAEDVREGWISCERATEVYGVALSVADTGPLAGELVVDLDGTLALRSQGAAAS